MSSNRRDPLLRDVTRPRSPAEALEPGRAPSRPRSAKRLREPPKAVSGFVRFFSGFLTLVVFGLCAAGGSVLLLRHFYEQPGPLAANTVLVIPAGEGRTEIAERLEREGVISNRWAFIANYLGQRYLGRREDLQLKAGEYDIKAGASMRDVLEIIAAGKSVGYKVVVPEGLTSQAIIERMKGDLSLAGEVTAIPAEGSLAPDTYSFNKGADRSEIVERMKAAQAQILGEAWEKRKPGLPFETKEQALVLASIVEKETGRQDEREKVAAVFVNRLKKGMALQSDPTILYGIYGGGVQWGKPILQSEKEAKNAHNTYQIKGLPPTPICNPGQAAIEAVLNPADTKDLYFVADGNGGHIFSETLKEHNEAVANWRKVEKDIRAKEAAAAKVAEKEKPVVPLMPAGVAAPAAPVASPVKTVTGDTPSAVPAVPVASPVKTVAPDGAAPAPVAKQVVTTVPTEGAVPVAPADGKATAATASGPPSTVPLPVRKPKR